MILLVLGIGFALAVVVAILGANSSHTTSDGASPTIARGREQRARSGGDDRIDFAGLLERARGSGRGSTSPTQEDLLKSLEGLSLNLPGGSGPTEATEKELDVLLAGFEGTPRARR